MHEGSRRAVVAALLANLGIAIVKFAVFLVTGAASMLAEAIHSVADTGNQGLLFLGGSRARQAPTPEHPFGFGSERYFWAFVVAVMLFTLGSLFALLEGTERMLSPQSVSSPGWALATLVVAMVLESLSFRTGMQEARKLKRPGWTWMDFIHRSTNPEVTVVLLEDSAALVGLVFAFTGIVLAWVTGNDRFDAGGSIAIGLLLGVVAVVLASEMKSLLIGESAGPNREQTIRDAMADGPEVRRVIHLRTLVLGPEELLVAAKLDIVAPSIRDLAVAIDVVEARVRRAVPTARVIYIEPDLYRDATESGDQSSRRSSER
ncbi:MAG TPA: cation diffusion facilitator family transporter [Acidimicrobiia bacterium]|nr:cation diffusion facilitator family transporter [Acidimicrobiia bacterium]